jgi:imidazole glycerol-phosphate synthase subunit HisH
MSTPDVAVVDYGVGNLLSVRRALEHCGAEVCVTSDPAQILAAPRVILPGVGAFGDGIGELRRRELDGVVHEAAQRGTPLFGICLGMQMLMDESEEYGPTPGLGLIAGSVVQVPTTTCNGAMQKIPHIGWNELRPTESHGEWRGTVLEDVRPGESVYFVHSFMALPSAPEDRIADCTYGGRAVTAVIGRDNLMGCQFHPEKSGDVGLRVLRRFLTL